MNFRVFEIAVASSLFLLAHQVTAGTLSSEQRYGDTLTLTEVVGSVLSHNDRVAAAKYMEQAAQARTGPAGAWDNPMLMLGVANLPTSLDFKEDGMTMRMVGLSQNIPYAGQKGLQAKAARSEANAASFERQITEIELAAAAKTAYFSLYYQQLIVQDIETQRQLTQDIVNSATALFESNKVILADVLAAQSDLWRLDADLLSARQDVDEALHTLLSLMGHDQDKICPVLGEVAFPLPPQAIDQWLATVNETYSPLLQLRHRSNSYRLLAKANKRMRWPMLNVGASYGFRSESPMEHRRDMLGLQITLSLPLFAGRQTGAMAVSMEVMSFSLDAEAKQMLRDIEAELMTLQDRINRLNSVQSLYQNRIIPAGEDAYQSALAAYRSNQLSMVDLLEYARTVYQDRIVARQTQLAHALAWVETQKYIEDPNDFSAYISKQ